MFSNKKSIPHNVLINNINGNCLGMDQRITNQDE